MKDFNDIIVDHRKRRVLLFEKVFPSGRIRQGNLALNNKGEKPSASPFTLNYIPKSSIAVSSVVNLRLQDIRDSFIKNKISFRIKTNIKYPHETFWQFASSK